LDVSNFKNHVQSQALSGIFQNLDRLELLLRMAGYQTCFYVSAD
jgi:hypothetical protein